MSLDSVTLTNKTAALSAMRAIAESTPGTLGANLARIYHPDAAWRGSHPWNELQGVDAIERVVWAPLLQSFPDLERRDSILMGGNYEGCDYVGIVGHLAGSFRRAWNGIPATGQLVYLRYGEFHQMVDGKIVQSTVLLDVLDFIQQAGFWPIAPSRGHEAMWPGPISADGILLGRQDPAQSANSLALTLAMQALLGAYDDAQGRGREGLLTMPQTAFWHPKMMWYGPSGIGSTRALEGFVDYHQLPFRIAFPNLPHAPKSAERGKDGKSHYVRIGDGRYSATGGWLSRYLNGSVALSIFRFRDTSGVAYLLVRDATGSGSILGNSLNATEPEIAWLCMATDARAQWVCWHSRLCQPLLPGGAAPYIPETI